MSKVVSVLVRRDGPCWSAWSPQCPGLVAAETTAEEMRAALPDLIAWYFDGDPDVNLRIHLELEVRGVIVRIAQDADAWERQLVAERLGAALGMDSQAEQLRAVRANAAGEVVYVCALPSDQISWLTGQMDDEDDAVVVALPATESELWTLQFDALRRRGEKAPGAGYRPEATFDEIMATFAGPRLQLSA
ncbi:hypothetical protein CcI156_03220 [Frankia sp. CcI156]|uniref:hypothetical protein n=1 Tax=Frankia TaxID=1854 RepID=UPI000053D20E|nr:MULTISPECIES: hypothetical protein [Frankia]ETA02993.1 hypothetical protein CcI6DRAFT_01515 [Frankia sp. CcI6]EYT92854.1 hypothetical protein ThrDRAFT_01430 [Frankia casuarinae]KEZ36088.1 hypothetical protein CEDDRAFT_02560 [Frankia sp. CeD]KFB05744.1 hypothetical protein ALLO2DRAFT_01380 [Frankia sp. Allo2]OHV57716.1 hypothetical protein CgIS1_00820 [Frankia sp. CgIS1]